MVCFKIDRERSFFLNVNDVCFPPSVLKKHCACKNASFIKCSWCEQTLCFTCFYDKYHPNNCNSLSESVDSEINNCVMTKYCSVVFFNPELQL